MEVELPRGRPKRTATNSRSTFAQWLSSHPGEKLPNSVREIAKITGLSESTIKNYTYHERQRAKKLIAKKPWEHDGKPVVWTEVHGYKISDEAFATVQAYVSKAGKIKFIVRLKDKSIKVFYLTSYQLEEMYGT